MQPEPYQSLGLFIGNGDQDNYIKLVASAASGVNGSIEILSEIDGVATVSANAFDVVFGSDAVDLFLEIDPANLSVTPYYQITSNGVLGPLKTFGSALDLPLAWLTGSTKLAVGLISTSYFGTPFTATWDLIEALPLDNPLNLPPTVTALAPQTVAVNTPVQLDGVVTDDGQPASSVLSVGWVQLSGPGTASFTSSSSENTLVTFSQVGLYVLELTADDSQYSVGEPVTIEVTDGSSTPTPVIRINAGGPLISDGAGDWLVDDAFVNTGNVYNTTSAINMSGVPSYLPPQLFQSEVYDVAALPDLNFSIPLDSGNYELRLYFAEIFSGAFASGFRNFDVEVEDQMVLQNLDVFAEAGPYTALMKTVPVTVTGGALDIVFRKLIENPAIKAIEVIALQGTGAENAVPVVTAGVDGNVDLSLTSNYALEGSYSDDGLPADSNPTVQWSLVTGPDTVSFFISNSLQTTVMFKSEGVYTLELLVSDGELTGKAAIQVVVTRTAVANAPPQVSSGQYAPFKVSKELLLSGSVTDDGLPFGTLDVQWSTVSGPGVVTFTSPGLLSTPAQFSSAGDYVLRFSASDGELTGTDTTQVKVCARRGRCR